MNQCDKRIKELLPLYYDQELTSNEKAMVDNHIAACEECSEDLQLYKMMSEEFSLDSEAPANFHQDLVQKLNSIKAIKKPSFYTRYNKYLNVAAMLVFVLFLSVIGLTQGNKWSESSNFTEDSMMMETSEEAKEEAKVVTSEDAKDEPRMKTAVTSEMMEAEAGNSDEVMLAESETEMLTVEATEDTETTESTAAEDIAATEVKEDAVLEESAPEAVALQEEKTEEVKTEEVKTEEADIEKSTDINEDASENQTAGNENALIFSADSDIDNNTDGSISNNYGNSALLDDAASADTEQETIATGYTLETDTDTQDNMLSGDGLNNTNYLLIVVIIVASIGVVVLVIVLAFTIRKNKTNK